MLQSNSIFFQHTNEALKNVFIVSLVCKFTFLSYTFI